MCSGLEVGRVAFCERGPQLRGSDDVPCRIAEFFLHGGNPLLCGGDLRSRSLGPYVLLEHVP